jgi:hypothetical protein
MKRYIWIHLVYLLCNVFHISAMKKLDPSIPVDNICHLKRLPLDVRGYIAFFLCLEDWEDKNAFLKRIKAIRALPGQWVDYIKKHKYNSPDHELMYETCPDTTKLALLMSFYQDRAHSTLTIVNKNEKKIYDGSFPYQIYQHIALTQSGRMIAMLHKQERKPEEIIHDYKNIVSIQKVVREKQVEDNCCQSKKIKKKLKNIKQYILPDGFTPTEIAFNKQGTHLAVRGFASGNMFDPLQKVFRIVRLKKSKKKPIDYNYIPSEQEKQQFLEDPLRAYLRCRMVCKGY